MLRPLLFQKTTYHDAHARSTTTSSTAAAVSAVAAAAAATAVAAAVTALARATSAHLQELLRSPPLSQEQCTQLTLPTATFSQANHTALVATLRLVL
jgi:hypothetical protein